MFFIRKLVKINFYLIILDNLEIYLSYRFIFHSKQNKLDHLSRTDKINGKPADR